MSWLQHVCAHSRCLVQVLLERCTQSGSTRDHGIAFTELNKHVEDPLSTFSSAQSIDTVLDRPLTMASATEHLHVPLSMLDDELDLSRCARATCALRPYTLAQLLPPASCRVVGCIVA